MGIGFPGNMGGVAILAVIGALLGFFSTIFWMVVGWRAMRAFETLSTSVEDLLQQRPSDEQRE